MHIIDRELMNQIDRFVNGDNLMSEKVRALQKLDQVMGVEVEQVTEQDVVNYLAEGRMVV